MRDEQRRRSENAVWTISEKYGLRDFEDLILEKGEKEEDAANFADFSFKEEIGETPLLEWAILGKAQERWEIAKLTSFVQRLQQRVSAMEAYETIWRLALEEALFPLLAKERPALRMFRRDLWQHRLQKLESRRQLPLEEDIRKAYAQEVLGLVPKVHPRIAQLITQLQKAAFINSADEMVLFLEEVYAAFFHLEKTSDPSEKKPGEEPVPQKQETTEIWLMDQGTSQEKNLPPKTNQEDLSLQNVIYSAEFNPNDESKKETVKKGAKAAAQKKESNRREMALLVERTYGRSLFLPGEQQRLEAQLCQGAHQFCRLHLTDGVLPEEQWDPWRAEFQLEQRQLNIKAFHHQEEIHLQNIARLAQGIRQVMLRNLEEERADSHRGRLNGGKVWRGLYLRDRKIFQKLSFSQEGKIAVDILMDASGSQRQQQEKVALQGYMIAQALSQCQIPCRVLGFNSFFDYTILRVFREYNDLPGKNAGIFDYWASGSNRDGLALRLMARFMAKEEMEHRILLVLNDAKPNDVRPGGEALSSRTSFSAYTGMAAVKDTAKAVRELRGHNIAVLGIYTGQEEFPAEQQIYGKDFVRIHDIQYFSTVVGTYLQRQLAWMLEER